MVPVQQCLTDYRLITIRDPESTEARKLHPRDTLKIHNEDLAWIKSEVENSALPVVILTHHAPSMACSEPDIPPSDPISAAFCSSLEFLFEDPVVAWGFGHTHFPMDYKSGTCHVVTNPAGYPNSEFPTPYGREFKNNFVLEA
jgi:hypothetical protein